MISVGNIPRFTRDIFVGGRDFTNNISHIKQVGMEEAEKIKCDPGDKAAEILHACDSTILDLVSEIRLSFD